MDNRSHFRQIKGKLLLWLSDTSGVTGIEYGIIGGFMGTLLIGTVFTFGDDINSIFAGLSPHFENNETEFGG